MKLPQLYFFILAFSVLSCNFEGKPREHKLVHKRIYVIDPALAVEVKDTNEKAPNFHSSYLELIFRQYELVDVKSIDSSLLVDLKYSDTSNFLKTNLYDGLKNAYLNCETALKLANAQFFLKQEYPKYSLIIFDAARPLHVQKMMWDSLKMHPHLKYNYLAPPYQNSLHNYGCAVDVSIMDLSTQKLLDMGTDYDFFGKLAQPINEEIYLITGALTKQAYENRLLLRKTMARAELKPINSEWWHFSMCTKEEAVKKFKLIQ